MASGGDFDPFSSLNAEDSVETTWIWPSNRSDDIFKTALATLQQIQLKSTITDTKETKTKSETEEKNKEDKLCNSRSLLEAPYWKPEESFVYPESEPNLRIFPLLQDMTNLQSWGFNAIRPGAQVPEIPVQSGRHQSDMSAVRLGVMWPGVEPVEGEYNHTYLQAANKGEDWKMTLADVFYPPIPLPQTFFLLMIFCEGLSVLVFCVVCCWQRLAELSSCS